MAIFHAGEPDVAYCDAGKCGKLSRDPGVRSQLVASKKEGLKVGVEATPTLFIDGFRYHGELDIAELTDVLEESYEQRVPRP